MKPKLDLQAWRRLQSLPTWVAGFSSSIINGFETHLQSFDKTNMGRNYLHTEEPRR